MVFVWFASLEQVSEASTNPYASLPKAELIVKGSGGSHGSIWKFTDGIRECYFNSHGGIWCAPLQ